MRPLPFVRSSFLGLALLVAAPDTARGQTEPEERAVYRAVLARFLGPEVRRLVLSDSTRQVRIFRSRFQPYAQIGPDELLDEFNWQNERRIALTDSLGLPVPVDLISAVQMESISRSVDVTESDAQYDWLRRRLPGSPGIVTLSRVGFAPGRDAALVYVFLDCGSRCAEGSYVLVRRRDGEWRVEHWITSLRS